MRVQHRPFCAQAVAFKRSSSIKRAPQQTQKMNNLSANEQRLAEFERAVDPNDPQQQELLQQMRTELAKLQEIKKNEDPRLSFCTPEFKEAQRTFTDAFKRNFGRPVEWQLVKEHPWSVPQLRKVDSAQQE